MIHSASHPIYQHNIQSLVAGYMETIKKHKLNIHIVTFGGISDDDSKRNENIIYDIPEKQVANTLFQAISNMGDYDIIIKTNTNTVINLPLLCEFCNTHFFENNILYSGLYMMAYSDNDDSDVIFPSGMFVMASHDTWRSIVNKKEDAIIYADTNFTNNVSIRHLDAESEKQLVWTGYSDEFLLGICVKLCGNIRLRSFSNAMSTISSSKHIIYDSIISKGMMKTDIVENLLIINCKLDIHTNDSGGDLFYGSPEEKFREYYEHMMISAICKIFMLKTPSYKDVVGLNEWQYWIG